LKRSTKPGGEAFSAAEFPRLRDFFSGYLHEDFQDEYGSAAGAARGFCGDGNNEEVRQTREEWTRLRRDLANRPLSELRAALQELGGAWRPANENELRSVDAAFAESGPGHPTV
jgi:CdiI immunity protein